MARFPKNLTVKENELKQEIDETWIGKRLSSDILFEIAYEIREYMINRVENGRGLGNETFKPNVYSKSYQESQEFKLYDKKPSPVNMRLTGDMLGSIRIDSRDGKAIIAIDDNNAPKAHGHQTGQYGKGPLPKRPFFGITKDEFKENILPKFRDRIEKEIAETGQVTRARNVQSLLDDLASIESLERLVKLVK